LRACSNSGDACLKQIDFLLLVADLLLFRVELGFPSLSSGEIGFGVVGILIERQARAAAGPAVSRPPQLVPWLLPISGSSPAFTGGFFSAAAAAASVASTAATAAGFGRLIIGLGLRAYIQAFAARLQFRVDIVVADYFGGFCRRSSLHRGLAGAASATDWFWRRRVLGARRSRNIKTTCPKPRAAHRRSGIVVSQRIGTTPSSEPRPDTAACQIAGYARGSRTGNPAAKPRCESSNAEDTDGSILPALTKQGRKRGRHTVFSDPQPLAQRRCRGT